MNNFTLRAITGFFFIAFISGMTLYSPYTFLILLLIIGGLGMMEYYKIVMRKEAYFLQLIFTLLGLTIISAYFWIDGRIDFALFGVRPNKSTQNDSSCSWLWRSSWNFAFKH